MKNFIGFVVVLLSLASATETNAQRNCLSGCNTSDRVSYRFDPLAAQAMFDSLFFKVDSLSAVIAACGCSAPPVSSHPCAAGSVEFQGYVYGTITIGGKTWFVENLQTRHYANGDSIPDSPNTYADWETWSALTTGSVYSMDGESNATTYGRLYNHYAVEDPRGLCPSGWHVATSTDFNDLATALGGSSVAGETMRSSSTDSPSWNGTNTSCFSALPADYRWMNPYAPFITPGVDTGWGGIGVNDGNFWWVPGVGSDPNMADMFFVAGSFPDLAGPFSRDRNHGFSVRCVQD